MVDVEIFPLRKISKKKKNIPKSHELEHSAELEIYPLLVENFPLWRNFVFGFWTFAFAKFEPKDAKWKFFHFGGKFSTFKKLQKKFFFLQNYMNWNILQRSKIFHFWWKTFHFGEILFSASRPSRLPNLIPNGPM